MDGRASFASLVALAIDGLRRKIGRNLLTMSGVFIGVFALTLIVSLGEGMTRLVQTAVSDSDNLRQIIQVPGHKRPDAGLMGCYKRLFTIAHRLSAFPYLIR